MDDELSKFLKFLFETDTGYVYSPVKSKTGKWEQRFFQWPSQQTELMDWINLSSSEGNVYVAPALFKEKKATKEAVLHSNVVWIEFDGLKAPDFKDLPAPDVIVQTSVETHIHAYWKVKKSNGPTIEDINRRLTYHLRADNSGWDCTQILRPPTTTNWKHTLPVKLVKYSMPLFKHKFEAFDKAPEIVKPPTVIKYDDLIPAEEVLQKHKLPEEINGMVLKELAVHPNRSTFLMRAGYILASANLDELELVSLLYHIDSRIKKFVGRQDQLMRLTEIANIAILDVTKNLTVEGYSPREISNNSVPLEWLTEGWLHRNGIMLVSGAPGVGKTQFCMDMAHHLAVGKEYLNRKSGPPVSIAVISLEMEANELKYILDHQMKRWEEEGTIDLYDANIRIFIPDEERSLSVYERIIATHKPRVVIIDSLSELGEDDLTNEKEARIIMAWVRKLRKEYDCAFVLIHHNRKATDSNKRPRKLSDLYGSYIFGKLSETVISLWDLEKDGKLEIDQFKLRFGKRMPLGIKRLDSLTFVPSEVNISVGKRSRETGAVNPLLEIFTEGNSS